jgi:2-amino-4-hydroxy-6-hydroxymethyldihydropteridine diphosphokinase
MPTAPPLLAAIALGANLGERAQILRRACELLVTEGDIVARSPVYETAPVGPPQPDYLNAVVLLRTTRPARALLDALLTIERKLGRIRSERWGARLLDLDLLTHGDAVVDEPGLTLPHPEIRHRAFVLVPLADVAPALVLPGVGEVRALLAALPAFERAGVRPTAHRL